MQGKTKKPTAARQAGRQTDARPRLVPPRSPLHPCLHPRTPSHFFFASRRCGSSATAVSPFFSFVVASFPSPPANTNGDESGPDHRVSSRSALKLADRRTFLELVHAGLNHCAASHCRPVGPICNESHEANINQRAREAGQPERRTLRCAERRGVEFIDQTAPVLTCTAASICASADVNHASVTTSAARWALVSTQYTAKGLEATAWQVGVEL